MRSIVLASCVLVVSSAQAEDAPGTKWLECTIGMGGHASAEDVYRKVIEVFTKGEAAGLTAVRLDDCTLFRVASVAGYAEAAHLMPATAGGNDANVVARVRARIEVEAFDLAKAPFTVTPGEHDLGPMLTVTTRSDMRLRLAVTSVSIDGRWYLWETPTLSGSDEVLAKRYGALVTELDKRLGKRTGADAIAVMDAWHKKRGAELDKLRLAAAATSSPVPVGARKTLEAKFTEPEVRRRIAELGFGPGSVGVPACDDFLERMWRCVEQLPTEMKSPMTAAIGQITDAWKGVVDGSPEVYRALEEACTQASQALGSNMGSMCPGVW